MNLHGSGGTAAQQEAFSAMDPIADANLFIVAYPEGAIDLGGGFAWNVPGPAAVWAAARSRPAPPTTSRSSRRRSRSWRARYPIDPRRIFVTGMSGGARMTSQLGCDLSTTIAAVAPVAGLRFPAPCNGTRAVPVISFHGTADTVNPYDGGGHAYWTYSVPSAAAAVGGPRRVWRHAGGVTAGGRRRADVLR